MRGRCGFQACGSRAAQVCQSRSESKAVGRERLGLLDDFFDVKRWPHVKSDECFPQVDKVVWGVRSDPVFASRVSFRSFLVSFVT